MKKLFLMAAVSGALLVSSAQAQSPAEIVLKVIAASGCAVEKSDLSELLEDEGVSKENVSNLMKALIASGRVKYDADTERYVLSGYGECE